MDPAECHSQNSVDRSKPKTKHTDMNTARHNRRDGPENLDSAIETQCQAILLDPEEQESKFGPPDHTINIRRRPFQRLAELIGIGDATECSTQASLLDSDRYMDTTPTTMNNPRTSHHNPFERSASGSEDSDRPTEPHIRFAPSNQYEKEPDKLDNLGKTHHHRFEQSGELVDINKAIEYQSQALLHTPSGHLLMPRRLSDLGSSYDTRFECLGEMSDIENAILYQNQAISLTLGDGEDKVARLGNLGGSYRRRFGRLGKLSDIDNAIQCYSQAISIAPAAYAGKSALMNGLGNSYQNRFDSVGNLKDIDEAIKCKKQAVSLTPDDQGDKAMWFNNLGSAYQSRFVRLDELADIDKAIQYKTHAASLVSDGHMLKSRMLSNLGNSHQRRFERLGDLEDLEKSIEYHSKAVSLTLDGHPDKPAQLNNLGSALSARFEHTGELVDIENAMNYQNQALSLTPDNHVDKPRWLENLGNSYHFRFVSQGTPMDIEKAIAFKSQALWLTPEGHATKTGILTTLARSYATRFQHLGGMLDIIICMSYLKSASQSTSGYPLAKLKASLAWAKMSAMSRVSPTLEAYAQVMLLIPQVVWLGATAGRRYQYIKSDMYNVGVEAAAVAISQGAYDRALEWLEEGRSIVWNQLVQLRTPFENFFLSDPALAHDMTTVARKLDIAALLTAEQSSTLLQVPSLEEAAQQHRRLAEKWEQLVARARLLPGLHDFLCPRKASELMTSARTGVVVFINVHDTRCDALVLRPGRNDVMHIPLLNFSYEKAAQARSDLARSLQIPSLHKRRTEDSSEQTRGPVFYPLDANGYLGLTATFYTILATLWTDVIKPVLEGLGYLIPLPVKEPPRITWCATGPLAFLPLHAAGCYHEPHTRIFNYVVSSYTPTLSALLDAPQSPHQFRGIVAVGQAATLPGTIAELDQIQKQAQNVRFTRIDGKHATPATVVAAIEQHSWVHFACHASQNASDPTKSAFRLHSGELDLGTLATNPLKHAQFAFLSACETAMGDEELPEEAVHLAAGMMVAGCPAVIASMWSIKDEDAPLVAKEVYAHMLGGEAPDSSKAAEALHSALSSLREKVGETDFARWVPYIHIGH